MKKITEKALILAAATLFAACGEAPASDVQADPAATEAAAALAEAAAAEPAAPAARKYGVRSGIIHSTTSGFGTGTVVTYFDDWGAKEAVHTTTELEVMGMKTVSRTVALLVDGWRTEYDPDQKTGHRWKEPSIAFSPIEGMPDLSTLSDAQRLEYGFEELEPRSYFGRDVPGFAISMGGMKIRGWVWENISFRSEMDMGGQEPMVTEVTEFQEGVPVPAEHFRVPADVTITEVQLPS